MRRSVLILAGLLVTITGMTQSSILWKITRNDLTAPSYLMGTLKFMGTEEFYLPDTALTLMKSCEIFAIEDPVDHHAQHELNKELHFPKGETLADHLKPADYERLVDLFEKELGIAPKTFHKKYDRLTPLAISIAITRLSLKEAVRFYDIELLNVAKKAKLRMYSLETAEREAQAIHQISMADQTAALVESINNFEKQKNDFRQLEAAFTANNIEKVFDLTLHPTEDHPLFWNEFYTRRNQEWLPKIEKMVHEVPSFVAVGIAHLEGDQGLLALLAKNGYTLTPVPVRK